MVKTYYSVSDEGTKRKVREILSVDNSSVKRDVEIVKKWIKQQPHLPQEQDDDFIERCLLINKFRVERTKEKIENYYIIKATHIGLFKNIKLPLPLETNLVFPLPTLTNKMERIIIFNAGADSPDDDDYLIKFFKYCLCCSEYSLRYDYSVGQRIIQDCAPLNFETVKKYLIFIAKNVKVLEGYFMRLAGMEYINPPPFADFFLNGLRSILPEKVYKKFSVHHSLESLHKNVNKAYLPKEFGGDLQPISELTDMWKEEFKSKVQYLEKMVETEIANMSLRVGDVKYNDFFGADGSFKKLAVD